jgi:hypothetical protein
MRRAQSECYAFSFSHSIFAACYSLRGATSIREPPRVGDCNLPNAWRGYNWTMQEPLLNAIKSCPNRLAAQALITIATNDRSTTSK